MAQPVGGIGLIPRHHLVAAIARQADGDRFAREAGKTVCGDERAIGDRFACRPDEANQIRCASRFDDAFVVIDPQVTGGGLCLGEFAEGLLAKADAKTFHAIGPGKTRHRRRDG